MPLVEIGLDAWRGYASWLGSELTTLHARNWVLWLLGLSAAAYLWELARPWRRDQARLRRDFWLDLFYLVFNFFLFGLILQQAGAAVLVEFFHRQLARIGVENLVALEVSAWPAWVQVAVLFVLRDFVHWNIHRLLHRVGWMWEFHKVHHSVREMGFAAHLRFHPAETVFYRTLEYIPLALVGFGIDDFFWAYLLSLLIGHINHANVVLPLGPMKYLLNNPQMHIWHHAKELPAGHRYGVNYGLSLSVWDYLFGTAAVPGDGRDIELGFPQVERYPGGFWGQLAAPFRRRA